MADKETKIVRRDKLSAIDAVLDAAEKSGITLDMGEITYTVLHEYIANEIDLLDRRAASAKERNQKRKEDGDALRQTIYEALDSEKYLSVDELRTKLKHLDLSAQTIVSRLNSLIKDINPPMVEKKTTTIPAPEGGKSRKATVYKRA